MKNIISLNQLKIGKIRIALTMEKEKKQNLGICRHKVNHLPSVRTK